MTEQQPLFGKPSAPNSRPKPTPTPLYALEWRKARPGYLRRAGHYEHGIDYASLRLACNLQRATSAPVLIVIREQRSPVDAEAPDTPANMQPQDIRLVAPLDAIIHHGHYERDWPRRSGEGSIRGQGGWCWARHAMATDGPRARHILRNEAEIETACRARGVEAV